MDYRRFRVTDNAAPASGYHQWADLYGGASQIGAATDDADFDGLSNLYEYGVGGNPTNGLDRGILPGLSNSGNRTIYVHPIRSDDTNITYTVETTNDLMVGAWTNQGYTVTGTNLTGGTFNFVTNDVDTVRNSKYIRLKIE
jgi:hypothetical protein